MIEDFHLDGNAIGGLLHDLFGREMTGEIGCCGNCGVTNPLGAVHVYLQTPGPVMRCPSCGTVLLVLVRTETGIRVSFEALSWLEAHALFANPGF
jgi:DNA-directed RNA polymerase subunit RPC12/RpoP